MPNPSLSHPRAGAPCALALLVLSTPLAALVGAQPDTDERYAYVVALRIDAGRRCSATKIGARTFLTAAHCVVDIRTGGLYPSFQPGGRVMVSARVQPDEVVDYQTLAVEETRLPPTFMAALRRALATQHGQRGGDQPRAAAEEPDRRVRLADADPHVTDRIPDAAIFRVGSETPAIPVASVDRRPLPTGADVILVGYGCEHAVGRPRQGAAPVRRTWGSTRVFWVGGVNFYTCAGALRGGTPSLCPGDSGGPVLAGGRVVGVHGTAWGQARRDTALYNMAVNLHSLAEWEAWPGAGTPAKRSGPGPADAVSP